MPKNNYWYTDLYEFRPCKSEWFVQHIVKYALSLPQEVKRLPNGHLDKSSIVVRVTVWPREPGFHYCILGTDNEHIICEKWGCFDPGIKRGEIHRLSWDEVFDADCISITVRGKPGRGHMSPGIKNNFDTFGWTRTFNSPGEFFFMWMLRCIRLIELWNAVIHRIFHPNSSSVTDMKIVRTTILEMRKQHRLSNPGQPFSIHASDIVSRIYGPHVFTLPHFAAQQHTLHVKDILNDLVEAGELKAHDELNYVISTLGKAVETQEASDKQDGFAKALVFLTGILVVDIAIKIWPHLMSLL
jgi:hypothetical protein